ncbi:TPA: hypothetical protein ACK3RK_004795 [Burkholderia cepacia]
MNDRRIAPQSIDVGAGEYLTPAQIILMFGFLAYEAPRVPTVAKSNARIALAAILRAATAEVFKSADLLDTLMARAERSPRVDSLIPALAPSCNGGRIDDADRTIQSSEVYRG